MNSAAILTSNEAFQPNLKIDPRLIYRKFRARVIYEASVLCNPITQNRGLSFFVFSETQWRALPGNTIQDAHGDEIFIAGYDILTPVVIPANNAQSMVVKMYEILRSERKEVLQSISDLTRKFVNSLPPDDISELSDELYGMMNVTLQEMFAHTERKYGILNQSDFDQIFDQLQAAKLPTQSYAALAELHRDLHSLLASAGQVSTEYSKTQYIMRALKDDLAGKYALEIFLRSYPSIPDRTFEDLVGIVILHAPTFIVNNAALGYSNAMFTTLSAPAITASANAASLDAVGLAQLIAKHQRELSALTKKTANPSAPPRNISRGPLKYCYKHGYQHSHLGAACLVLQGNPQLYTPQHLAATDHLNPAGGNPVSRG